MRAFRAVAALLVAAFLAGCGGGFDQTTGVIKTVGGPVTLELEIAESHDERQQGLMGRESLAEQAGMLFVYPEPHRGSFWMKDTLIPLSIAFLGDRGRVLKILDMEPCRADPCPLYDPGISYSAALEVNQGAFDRWGVEAGDVVTVGD
jgi:uncharacterized membrane protein (UPF0127 family)